MTECEDLINNRGGKKTKTLPHRFLFLSYHHQW